MELVRSGALLAALVGWGTFVSCSAEPRDEDGARGEGGSAGKPVDPGGGVGGSQAGRGGQAGQSEGGEGGEATGTGGAGGDDSGGGGADGGSGASGGKAGSGGASAGMAGSGGASGAAGGPSITCGNGRIDAGESCDDGARASGNGCSSTCAIEDGYHCEGAPSACHLTVCGDRTTEGNESCDDGNALPFDGCGPDCRREPSCASGMPCTSPCGDGIVHGNEACDDGNARSGDGCSSTCMVEDGFMCENDAPCEMVAGSTTCSMTVPAVFRDFNANASTGGHPDFQPGYNHDGVTQGLVQPTLDNEGKPVLSSAASVQNAFMHGAAEFAQWYGNGAPASAPIPATLRLWHNGLGGYVNRWGQAGEQWRGYPHGMIDGMNYPSPQQCSNTDCTACAAPPTGMVCLDDCLPWNSTQACFAAEVLYDGSPLFFPIDAPRTGILNDTRLAAKVPEQYGWNGWPSEVDVATRLGFTAAAPTMSSTAPFPTALHNFSFTTEVKHWFKYDAAASATLDFTGDDDVWVFVNGRLTVDLGAWHVPLNGSVTIAGGMVTSTSYTTLTGAPVTTTGTAAQFGLESGGVYSISVFHAERQTDGSSFRLSLTGMNNPRSRCRPL